MAPALCHAAKLNELPGRVMSFGLDRSRGIGYAGQIDHEQLCCALGCLAHRVAVCRLHEEGPTCCTPRRSERRDRVGSPGCSRRAGDRGAHRIDQLLGGLGGGGCALARRRATRGRPHRLPRCGGSRGPLVHDRRPRLWRQTPGLSTPVSEPAASSWSVTNRNRRSAVQRSPLAWSPARVEREAVPSRERHRLGTRSDLRAMTSSSRGRRRQVATAVSTWTGEGSRVTTRSGMGRRHGSLDPRYRTETSDLSSPVISDAEPVADRDGVANMRQRSAATCCRFLTSALARTDGTGYAR